VKKTGRHTVRGGRRQAAAHPERTSMTEKRRALGKGLSALIPDAPEPAVTPLEVDIDQLTPNDFQPRRYTDADALDRLARSIKTHGIIQPIVVRRLENGTYQIIAGERRWRAAQHAGLLRVPVSIRDVPHDGERLLEMALIENIQREDLNPIEEAKAYEQLGHQFHLTQETIAAAVGKDRASVANFVRLLKLPADVQGHVEGGALSMGHARALLGLEDVADLRRAATDVVARGLSVRETEALVKRLIARAGRPTPAPEPPKDVHTRAAEDELKLSLGTPVHIVRRRKGGTIEIDYATEDELQRLYEHLTRR
jgi:ParB family chromosome partitioning protein